MLQLLKSVLHISFLLCLLFQTKHTRIGKEFTKETELNLFSTFQASTSGRAGYILVIAFEIIKKSSSKTVVRPYYMFTSAQNANFHNEARNLFEMNNNTIGKLSRNFAKTTELDFELTSKQNEKKVSFEVTENDTKHEFVLTISKTPLGKNLAQEFVLGTTNIKVDYSNGAADKPLRMKLLSTSDLSQIFLRFDQNSQYIQLSKITGSSYPIKFICEFSNSSVVSLSHKETVVVNLHSQVNGSFLINLFYDLKLVGEVKQIPFVQPQLRNGFLNLPTFFAPFKDIIVLINNSFVLDYLFILDKREQPKLMLNKYDFNEKKASTAKCTEVK